MGVRVFFAYARLAGSRGLPGCSGVDINLRRPQLIGTDIAGAGGGASVSLNVPLAAGGRTIWFQAAQKGSCRISNLVEHAFP